jgi:polysaccharide lyase-like protein
VRPLVPLLALATLAAAAAAAAATPPPVFVDDFEKHAAGQLPGAPWKEEMYKSGAVIVVDDAHAFSGKQSMHILTPAGANKRRGYVAIHLKGPLPELQSGMYGRLMAWLDEAPIATFVGEPNGGELPHGPLPMHWTLLQGEGRSADDRYNSIYRLGVMQQGGTQLMANFETTPPVKTNCMQQSKRSLPVRRWACIEWHMEVASNEMQFWIDGRPIAHVQERAAAAGACDGHDLDDRWLAPPRFDSLYVGFERYGDTGNDQNLWIDDVALSKQRVGCPAKRSK